MISIFLAAPLSAQVISIDSVRSEDANGVPLLMGQTVSVRGTVSTHQEMGTKIVYFQNPTAGLVAFDSSFCAGVTRGDSVLVTGIVTQFNGLTELQPVNSFSLLASGRTVNPIIVTPGLLRNSTGEQYEGMLIKIIGVTQVKNTNGSPATNWTVSGSGTNFRLLVGIDSVDIRIYATSNIANTPVHSYPFNVIAVQSQFKSSAPFNSGYQIIPRDLNDFTNVTAVNQLSSEIPQKFSLHQNYPNPFNPVSLIKYDVLKSSRIKIEVYDLLGRKVSELVNENQSPGTYETSFNASNLSSGMYFYSLFVDGAKIDSKKMILSK